MKQYWQIQVGQGNVLYSNAAPVAQLLAETETEEFAGLTGPWTQQVFEAIDHLKIITAPPVSFIISPVDSFAENDLTAAGPDWIGRGTRVWILSGS